MATVTTTVALIGADAVDAASALAAGASNISLVSAPEPVHDPLVVHQRHLAVWREARTRPPVYMVIPADPMAMVVQTWAARLTGGGDGELETLIGLTPNDPMPHYYIVSPELAEPHIHWYHGLLAGFSTPRIVPSSLDTGSLRKVIAALPTGRELPDMRHVAGLARTYVPVPELTVPS